MSLGLQCDRLIGAFELLALFLVHGLFSMPHPRKRLGRRLRPELLERRILLAARLGPSPTILPEFDPSAAVLVTTPAIQSSDEADHGHNPAGFPILNDPLDDGDVSDAPLTNDDTFKLHSKPDADHTIYLDFDGSITEGTNWNNSTGITTLIDIAYNRDGDHTTFNNSELNQIREIWKLVAEDFAPFNVNVTTEDPGVEALRKSGSGDTQWGIRSLHTSNTNGVCGGCGGVAYIGSFSSSVDLPAYSFNKGVSAGGNTQSHEVGHAVRLGHDGLTTGATYYNGHGGGNTSWGPIMGGPGGRKLKTWSNGDYYNANNQQDDLDRISSLNGFSYRADDHGNTFAVASPLSVTSASELSGYGIISQNHDVDFFQFESEGGNVSFDIVPFITHPNLDVWAGIYDSNGTLIAESNPFDNVSATFSDVALSAGTHFLKIDGVGSHGHYNAALDAVFDPGENDYTGSETEIPWAVSGPVGYSDYASIGQYWITGTRQITAGDLISITGDENHKKEDAASETTPFTFTVSRAGSTAGDVDVAYSVLAATPTVDNNNHPFTVDGDDFVGGHLPNGTVTIPDGQSSVTLTLNIAGDDDYERDEHFSVLISSETNGWLVSESTATGTILSDESSVGVQSQNTADVTLDEGGPGGGAVFTYTLFRRGDLSVSTTADWQVNYGTFANAASDDDFVGGTRPGGQVVFAPGQTEVEVQVEVSGDFDVEADESFWLEVTGASGDNTAIVDPATPRQRGIILNDEAPITIIDEVQFRLRQIRNGTGTRDAWAIDNVSLPGTPLVENFDPDIDSALWADLQNATVNNDASIFPGSNGRELLMRGTGDRIATTVGVKPALGTTLSFDLILGNGVGNNGADNVENGKNIWLEYSVDGSNWEFLREMEPNDYETWRRVNVALPDRVTVPPDGYAEGNSGATPFDVNLVRTGNLDAPGSADWQVVASGSATEDDFIASPLPSGTVTFSPGEGLKTITIEIAGDTDKELDETFDVVLTSATGGPPTGGPRTITIINDEVPEITGVIVNNGEDQRSSLHDIAIEFDGLVDVDGSAVVLTYIGSDNFPDYQPVSAVSITAADVDGRTIISVTPNASHSFSDGNYLIDVFSSGITARESGENMAQDYQFGNNATDRLFRKYGDDNGNRVVDLFDFAQFRARYDTNDGDDDYAAWLDETGDGAINLFDFARFRANFGS